MVRGTPPDYGLAIPTLIESLKANVESARTDAAIILGDLGPDAKTAVPALPEALQDNCDRVRQAVAEALRKMDGS